MFSPTMTHSITYTEDSIIATTCLWGKTYACMDQSIQEPMNNDPENMELKLVCTTRPETWLPGWYFDSTSNHFIHIPIPVLNPEWRDVYPEHSNTWPIGWYYDESKANFIKEPDLMDPFINEYNFGAKRYIRKHLV